MPVESFLKSLQETYASRDTLAIAEHYSLPTTLVKDHGTELLANTSMLHNHINRKLDDLERSKVTRFAFHLVKESAVAARLTLLRYQLEVEFADRTAEPPSYGALVLREQDNRLCITVAIATNMRWQKRAQSFGEPHLLAQALAQ